MQTLAATTTPEPRTWAGIIALAAAYLIFRLIVVPLAHRFQGRPTTRPPVKATMHRIREMQVFDWGRIGGGPAPTTPPSLPRGQNADPQATAGVIPGDTLVEPFSDTLPDTLVDTGRDTWWQRVTGSRTVRRARQVVTTGSSELPEDDDIDLALDEPEPDEAPVDGRGGVGTAKGYVRRALDTGVPYNRMVDVLMDLYGLSESTAKRRIREVRDERKEGREAA